MNCVDISFIFLLDIKYANNINQFIIPDINKLVIATKFFPIHINNNTSKLSFTKKGQIQKETFNDIEILDNQLNSGYSHEFAH